MTETHWYSDFEIQWWHIALVIVISVAFAIIIDVSTGSNLYVINIQDIPSQELQGVIIP